MIVLRRIRGRAALAIAATAVAFTTIASFAERKAAVGDAASRALQGPAFGLAIPLATLALVTAALSGGRLDDAMNPAALLGANRRSAAIGAVAAVGTVAGVLGLLTASTAALAANGPPTTASLTDAMTAGWIGGLTAVTYTFLFMAASGFGVRGGVRTAALLADLMIGPVASPIAILLPRAHGLNLLGAAHAANGLGQPSSTAALVALCLLFGLILLARVRP
jgi:hypothetical protein